MKKKFSKKKISLLKFRLSEKDTKFEKIFHSEFEAMNKDKF